MKFHEKALKGIIKSESPLQREETLVEVPYEKRDPTCPGALYDKYSEIPALRDK